MLWIGYLQWHFRTRGDVHPPQPVIRDFRNIENRDAVLAYDGVEYVTDEQGRPVTRWDGETMKVSPVTGEQVPDEHARKPVERYVNPRKAAWPEADFIVGNPPFIGNKRMRTALGDGYVEALRGTWPEMPESADFVMYWWHHAAQLTRSGAVERFGFITTNSIRQSFNRRVLEPHLADKTQPLSLVFAIPDHPWVDTADGAAVRIAMTVGRAGELGGAVREVLSEGEWEQGEAKVELRHIAGVVHADLRVGADLAGAATLREAEDLHSNGFMLAGSGFILETEDAERVRQSGLLGTAERVRPYRNGRDLTQTPRGVYVIDLFGLSEEEVRNRHPALYQHVLSHVKPERDENRREKMRRNWWLFGESRVGFRNAVQGLGRYVATVETSKHRFFTFLDAEIAPDHKLNVVAVEDAALLGVLSSTPHVVWALAKGSRLGVGNDPVYLQTKCLRTFPFPNFQAADKFAGPFNVALVEENGRAGNTGACGEYPSHRIRRLGEQLDAHRKRQQAAHPGLTLTGVYNVLEKLRSGEPLTAKERIVHEQGLVSVLRQLHDELDEAVLHAYGWGDLLPALRVAHGNDPASEGQTHDDARRAFDEAILERLVALNAERAAAEARGEVLWLRPEFQNPDAARDHEPEQTRFDTDTAGDDQPDPDATPAPLSPNTKPQPWPKDTVDQVRAVADLLAASPVPLSIDEIGARFTARGPWKKRLPKLLEMLVALGRARNENERFSGS